jgi:PAS domain S-box-containing protein
VSGVAAVTDPLIQQTLLGEAVDNGPAAIFVLGEDMKYVAVNETACTMLGYERDELLALGPADLAPDADLDERFGELGRTGHLSGTARLRTKSGEVVEFAYRASETTAARMRFWISVGFPL